MYIEKVLDLCVQQKWCCVYNFGQCTYSIYILYMYNIYMCTYSVHTGYTVEQGFTKQPRHFNKNPLFCGKHSDPI